MPEYVISPLISGTPEGVAAIPGGDVFERRAGRVVSSVRLRIA